MRDPNTESRQAVVLATITLFWLLWASRIRCTERRLTPAAFARHPAGPVGCFSRRRPERQVDHSLRAPGCDAAPG
jgi:hypothetical protein